MTWYYNAPARPGAKPAPRWRFAVTLLIGLAVTALYMWFSETLGLEGDFDDESSLPAIMAMLDRG